MTGSIKASSVPQSAPKSEMFRCISLHFVQTHWPPCKSNKGRSAHICPDLPDLLPTSPGLLKKSPVCYQNRRSATENRQILPRSADLPTDLPADNGSKGRICHVFRRSAKTAKNCPPICQICHPICRSAIRSADLPSDLPTVLADRQIQQIRVFFGRSVDLLDLQGCAFITKFLLFFSFMFYDMILPGTWDVGLNAFGTCTVQAA